MFDQPDFPYSETFVREAIQNSLDARLSSNRPVRMDFTFHEDESKRQKRFLRQVMQFREEAKLDIPIAWRRGKVHWIVVEDSNSHGLRGNLNERKSDFWNYWLNFGVSNKTSRGRGGRGIGRVTFLIASQVKAVIGYTRRRDDWQQAVCGMVVLPPFADEEHPRATHAYLAKEEQGSVWQLHDPAHIAGDARDAFRFQNYEEQRSTGLALAIPYPHDELKPNGILAAAIENFAPAIMSDVLDLYVDGVCLDRNGIDEAAKRVTDDIPDPAIRDDPARFLNLIRCALSDVPAETVSLATARRDELARIRAAQGRKYAALLNRTTPLCIKVQFPLNRGGTITEESVTAVLAPTPPGKQPIDRLFREGMSLPRVRSRTPGEIDLVLLVDSSPLAEYLNLCEGKAHLDLSESKEISEKIRAENFIGGYDVKRLIKALPTDIRQLFTPDYDEPDSSVFNVFFSAPKKRKDGPDPPPPPPPPPPPFGPTHFQVRHLADGFELRANKNIQPWPENLTVHLTMAYADGTRKPSWSPFDFNENDLQVENTGCHTTWKDNVIELTDCTSDCQLKVTGFDTDREVDTTIRESKDA